jgi:hypothetical protein
MPFWIGNYDKDPSGTGLYSYNGKPIWGSSGGIVYQYGRDSSGRSTYGPGTAEDGTPLGNQDQTMIGQDDPRYRDAQSALSQHPGYVQVRVNAQGAPGGFKDPSKLTYDPVVGLITPQDNIVQGPDDTLQRMLMVGVGGPLLGVAGNALFGAGAVATPGTAGTLGVGADGTIPAAASSSGGSLGGSLTGGEEPGSSFDPYGETAPDTTPGGYNDTDFIPNQGDIVREQIAAQGGVEDTLAQQAGALGDTVVPEGSLLPSVGQILTKLPAIASALKPLVSKPPAATTPGQAQGMGGSTAGVGDPQAHPFAAA